MERFAGLNVCSFNPIEVFTEILLPYLSEAFIVMEKLSWYSRKLQNLAQRNLPCLQCF